MELVIDEELFKALSTSFQAKKEKKIDTFLLELNLPEPEIDRQAKAKILKNFYIQLLPNLKF